MLILQWNMNGFFAKKEFLELLIKESDYDCICLQETNFKENFCASIRGYQAVHNNRSSSRRASGGVAIYIKDKLISETLHLNTLLESTAVRLRSAHSFTICNIYLLNSRPSNKNELLDLVHQLPTRFIICGYFNGHNSLWGSESTDSRGKIIESWYNELDTVVLLNNGSSTHFDVESAKQSSIDLTFASSTIASDLQWIAREDNFSSDHYPIEIDFQRINNKASFLPQKWLIKNAHWNLYYNILIDKKQSLPEPSSFINMTANEIITPFIDAVSAAANDSISKSSGVKRGKNCTMVEPRMPNRNQSL